MFDGTRVDLAAYTSLRLGGPAESLVVATHRDEAVQMAMQAPAMILAGGTNVVISDEGVPGRVVLLRSRGVRVEAEPADGEWVRLAVEAGHAWGDVVDFAVAEGLAGIECLAGIPGSAGATPIQNVGAYGQEVAETIVGVQVLDRVRGEVCELPPGECGFTYRASRFKGDDRYVVLGVTFRLRRSALSGPLRYAELIRHLGVAAGRGAPLAEVRAAVLALRRNKGMVLDDADPDTRSAGSFFTNPVLDTASFAALRQRTLAATGSEPPAWPGGDGSVKVSAAWLIEHAGFAKGYRGAHEGVAVSGKHTLALTNRGTGTTTALLGLAREIREGVRKTFDVELRPEPVLVNCAL